MFWVNFRSEPEFVLEIALWSSDFFSFVHCPPLWPFFLINSTNGDNWRVSNFHQTPRASLENNFFAAKPDATIYLIMGSHKQNVFCLHFMLWWLLAVERAHNAAGWLEEQSGTNCKSKASCVIYTGSVDGCHSRSLVRVSEGTSLCNLTLSEAHRLIRAIEAFIL